MLSVTRNVQYYHWAGESNPALAKCAAAVRAMAANVRRARTSAGVFLSLASQRKTREPDMGIVRLSLRWPYTFYDLAC